MAYKILSLDGGGSWAMIQARVLKDIYGDIYGHALLQQFDMVIANSGGSMVLAALCNNMRIGDIIDVFATESKRTQIFSHLTLREEVQNIVSLFEKYTKIGPKYSTPRKLLGLRDILISSQVNPKDRSLPKAVADSYLDELPTFIGKPDLQLIIMGYDYFRRRANFFRSNPNSATNKFSGSFPRVTLANAVHASSNAPVNYFNEPATIKTNQVIGDVQDERTTWFWDGAVGGFNNPVLAGLIEATTNSFAANPKDYHILSIGTGTGDKAVITDYDGSTNPDTEAIYRANLNNPLAVTDHSFHFLHDVEEISTSILADPPDTDTFIAYSILHPTLENNGTLVRINPCFTPLLNTTTKKYDYPDVYANAQGDYRNLLELDMDAVQQDQVNLIISLCDKFIVNDVTKPRLTNQLIRGQYDKGTYLGHKYYKEAKNRWEELL